MGEGAKKNAIILESVVGRTPLGIAAAAEAGSWALAEPARAAAERADERPDGLAGGTPPVRRDQSRRAVSNQIVTGPSLQSATRMWAPKTPVGTARPNPDSRLATNWRKSGAATSGGAASV